MRRKITALLLLTIILAIPCYNAIGAENNPLIDISRDVNIQLGGIVSITDSITLGAPTGESRNIQSLWMGYLDNFEPEQINFLLKQGDNWTPLTYESEIREENQGYLIELPTEQTISGSEKILIQAEYTHINLIIQASSNIAVIPAYPILEYNISSLDLSIRLPESSEYESWEAAFNITNNNNSNGIWEFEYASTEVSDWENSSILIEYKPGVKDIFIGYYDSLEHIIKIRNDHIIISETYALKNKGNTLQIYEINIPSLATDIWAHDYVGSLPIASHEINNITDLQEVIFYPRGPIYNDNKWTFTLTYRLPYEEHISGQTLTYTINTNEFYVKELRASIIIPEGGDYTSSIPEPYNVNSQQETTIQYILGSKLPFSEDTVSVEFTLSAMNTWIKPLVALIFTAGIFGGVILFRKQKKPESITNIKAKKDKTSSEYVNMYKNRLIILKEYHEVLETQKEEKLTEISKTLESSYMEVKEEEALIEKEESIQQLKILKNAEKEIANIKNDLNNLENRLRTRRISKRDFERRRESRIKRLYQAIETIEKALIELAK